MYFEKKPACRAHVSLAILTLLPTLLPGLIPVNFLIGTCLDFWSTTWAILAPRDEGPCAFFAPVCVLYSVDSLCDRVCWFMEICEAIASDREHVQEGGRFSEAGYFHAKHDVCVASPWDTEPCLIEVTSSASKLAR